VRRIAAGNEDAEVPTHRVRGNLYFNSAMLLFQLYHAKNRPAKVFAVLMIADLHHIINKNSINCTGSLCVIFMDLLQKRRTYNRVGG
jgi:hypothetical protein